MARTPKAVKVAAHLRVALRAADKAYSDLVCWRIQEKLGLEYTEEQRAKMGEASRDLEEARRKVKDVYAEILGRLMVNECDQ